MPESAPQSLNMHHTHHILLAFAGLLMASLLQAQLIPSASLPVAEPPIPYAPPPSASNRDVDRWVWGNWQYRERQKLLQQTPSATTFSGIDVIKVTLIALKTDLTLEWDYINQGQTGFTVERSTNGTTFTNLATLADPAARAYTDKGLAAGSYWYRVRAYKPATISAPSNVATGTIP